MQEREKIKAKHGSSWDKMTPQEQDNAIDNWMMDPQIRARYAMHRVEREEVVCYPKLLIQTGQKIVHFGEEVPYFTHIGGFLLFVFLPTSLRLLTVAMCSVRTSLRLPHVTRHFIDESPKKLIFCFFAFYF